MTPTRLHPTPTRLRYLADADGGRLPERLTTAMYDLLAAGWIEADGVVGRWRITRLLGGTWRLKVAGRERYLKTKPQAREDLLHLAAAALANDPDFNTSTDQEEG